MLCPNCGTVLEEGDLFCAVCGTRRPAQEAPPKLFCERCGREIGDVTAQFCPHCGGAVPAAPQTPVPPAPASPQAPVPPAPASPQTPVPPAPASPQAPVPPAPAAPQTPVPPREAAARPSEGRNSPPPPKARKKGKGGLIALLLLLILAAAGAAGAWFFLKSPGRTAQRLGMPEHPSGYTGLTLRDFAQDQTDTGGNSRYYNQWVRFNDLTVYSLAAESARMVTDYGDGQGEDYIAVYPLEPEDLNALSVGERVDVMGYLDGDGTSVAVKYASFAASTWEAPQPAQEEPPQETEPVPTETAEVPAPGQDVYPWELLTDDQGASAALDGKYIHLVEIYQASVSGSFAVVPIDTENGERYLTIVFTDSYDALIAADIDGYSVYGVWDADTATLLEAALDWSTVPDSSDPGFYDDGYLFPTDTQYITYGDLDFFTREEIVLIRNEIYARHGCSFNDADIRAYFESKSWYSPIEGLNASTFDASVLNDYEYANVDTILAYEREMGWRT